MGSWDQNQIGFVQGRSANYCAIIDPVPTVKYSCWRNRLFSRAFDISVIKTP